MLELLFLVLMFVVFGKMFLFGMKATWGITKMIVTIVLLPLSLVAMVLGGLFSLAFPILLGVGVISLFCRN